MAENLGVAVLELRTDSNRFNRDIDTARKRAAKLEAGFKQVGKALLGFGVIAAGVALTTIKMATDFNESMANVATLIPGNIDRVNELKSAVQDLAIAHGKDTADLAKGLYQTISAFGDKAGQTVKILEINSKAAAAGLAETTQAVDLTSAVTKAYGDTSAVAVQKVADLALMTVRLGQTDFPALARSMGRVTPIAEAMGQSQEELFAVFATATGVVGTASEVATQYRGVLAALQDPTTEMSALLKKMEVASGEAALEQFGLIGVLQKMKEAAEENEIPLIKYVKSIEAVPLALALAGPQADVFASKLGELGDVVGAVDVAHREQTEGINKLGFQWKQITQQFVVAAQTIGDILIPVVSFLLTEIQNLINDAGGIAALSEWFRSSLPGAISFTLDAFVFLTRVVLTLRLGYTTAVTGMMELWSLFVAGVNSGVALLIRAYSALLTAMRGLREETFQQKLTFDLMQQQWISLADSLDLVASGSMQNIRVRTKEWMESIDEATLAQTRLERGVEDFKNRLLEAIPVILESAKAIDAQTAKVLANQKAQKDAANAISEKAIALRDDLNPSILESTGLMDAWGAGAGSAVTEATRSAIGLRDGIVAWERDHTILNQTVKTGAISLADWIGSIRTGDAEVDSFLGKMKRFLGIFKSIAGVLSTASSRLGDFFSKLGGGGGGGGEGFNLGGLFGGGGGEPGGFGALFGGAGEEAGTGILAGLKSVMGKVSNLLPIIGPLLAIFGGPLLGGIKAIFGRIFGGPGAAELEARGTADAFKPIFKALLTTRQLTEAGGAVWKQQNIAQRDIIIALGGSVTDMAGIWARFQDRAKNPDAANAFKAFWDEKLTAVQTLMSETGLTLDELKKKAEAGANEAATSAKAMMTDFQNVQQDTVSMTTSAAANAAKKWEAAFDQIKNDASLSAEERARQLQIVTNAQAAAMAAQVSTTKSAMQSIASLSISAADATKQAWVSSATSAAAAWEQTRRSTVGRSSILEIERLGSDAAGRLGDAWRDNVGDIERIFEELKTATGERRIFLDQQLDRLGEPGQRDADGRCIEIKVDSILDGEKVAESVVRHVDGALADGGVGC